MSFIDEGFHGEESALGELSKSRAKAYKNIVGTEEGRNQLEEQRQILESERLAHQQSAKGVEEEIHNSIAQIDKLVRIYTLIIFFISRGHFKYDIISFLKSIPVNHK